MLAKRKCSLQLRVIEVICVDEPLRIWSGNTRGTEDRTNRTVNYLQSSVCVCVFVCISCAFLCEYAAPLGVVCFIKTIAKTIWESKFNHWVKLLHGAVTSAITKLRIQHSEAVAYRLSQRSQFVLVCWWVDSKVTVLSVARIFIEISQVNT